MFALKLAVGTNNIPRCQWESIIPPPFLEQWKAFLELLSSHNFQGNEVDAMVLPLIPMFHTEAYNLPLRILKEQEVIQLSGLHNFWNNVSLSDAELVLEALLRNVCGNCFHPDLISSALGSDTILRSWAKGEVEGDAKSCILTRHLPHRKFCKKLGQLQWSQTPSAPRRMEVLNLLDSLLEGFTRLQQTMLLEFPRIRGCTPK